MKKMDAIKQNIIIVTGKGGVGKSTIAATIALDLSLKQKKVLLVELGEHGHLKSFFSLHKSSYKPQLLTENLSFSVWNVASCLEEYILHYVKIRSIYRLFFENKVMRSFIRAAPTLSELAILGKLTSGILHVGPPFTPDIIVVDAYSTGHFLSLLRAPKGISDLVPLGPMGQRARNMFSVLMDPKHTQYILVTLAESLPTSETQDLLKTMKYEFNITPHLLCNRLLQIPEKLINKTQSFKTKNQALIDFNKYLNFVESRQKHYLSVLRSLDPEMIEVPLLLETSRGEKFLHTLAGQFSRPLEIS